MATSSIQKNENNELEDVDDDVDNNQHHYDFHHDNQPDDNQPDFQYVEPIELLLPLRERIFQYRNSDLLGKYLTAYNLNREYIETLNSAQLNDLLKQIKYSINVRNTNKFWY
jgi:hypothetical protein